MTNSARPARTRAAIAATGFAFLATMLGTTLPTPLYSIYSAQLSFSELTVTILFAVYAIGVVAALALFGKLSDQLGRRPVLLIAVAFGAISAVMFLMPPSLPVLIVARVLSGLSAGFMSGTGTAALVDLFPPAKKATGGTLAIAVNTGGLALGTLIAGLLATFAPAPLILPYATHLVLSLLAAMGLWLCTPAPVRPAEFRFRPQRLHVPTEIRGAFARAVLAAGSGFAMTGALTSVSALFLARELHITNHAMAGLVVFLAFACTAAGQLLAKRLRPLTALALGSTGLIVAAAMFALAMTTAQLWLLLVTAVLIGISTGFCMNAGIAMTVEQVPPVHRGEVSSSFFAGIYTMLAVPAIGVGLLSTVMGLRNAGLVFAGAVLLLSAVVCTLVAATARTARTR